MPGLVGIVWNNKIDESLVDRMANSIKHEKWQRIDKYSDSFFNVARVSLGIFNPEPQPSFNENKTLCIFMYGKVYDYGNKLDELKSRGHQFIIGNDTEFCLHSFEEYGRDFVKGLNGSFVLVICDLKQNIITIVNDRYGLRPLYYALSNGKLLFASEVKAILEDNTINKGLNDEAIAEFFAFQGEIIGNKTFFKSIEVLPPATFLTYSGGKVSTEQYWDFNYEPDYKLSEDKIVEQLVEIFTHAVDVRIKDNLRYGVLLSGGLDSRSIVGAMDVDRRKSAVTVTFGMKGCDEAKIAEVVSRKANIRHIPVEIIEDEVVTPYSEDVVRMTDGMDTILVGHQLLAYRRVKPYVDVLFDGQIGSYTLGGDGLLLAGAFKAKNDEDLAKILDTRRMFPDHILAQLYTHDYYAKVKDVPWQSVKGYLANQKIGNYANKLDYFLLLNFARRFNFLGETITRNVVEDTTPFYDNDFIDLVLKIPPELRANHYIYRKFLMKLAPDLAAIPYQRTMVRVDAPLILWRAGQIYQGEKGMLKKLLWRKTAGRISLPNRRSYINFDEWLRLNVKWRDFVKGILLGKEASSRDYFNRDYIETLIKEQESGTMNHSGRLAYLATFELFLKMFVDD